MDSPQHAEFVRERERLRSERRRKERAALVQPSLPRADAGSVPPVLPPLAGANPSPTPVAGDLSMPPAGAVVPVAGVVIPWTTRMLQKPAALLTRIIDRLRMMQLNKRIARLGLTPQETAVVKRDLEWQEKALVDFQDALAEVSALGLNKAGLSSEYSPYINLAMSAGELGYAHIAALDRLEKMYQMKLAAIKEKAAPEPAKV